MKINVITFNIRWCDDRENNSVAQRAPRLNQVLSKYDADIIGLQEARPNWEPYFAEYFSEEYDMFLQYRAEEEKEAAPILWKKDKFELVKKGVFWLSDTPEIPSKGWDERYDCYRMCEYVILKDKNTKKELLFMNTHFGFGDKCQTDSAELIQKYNKAIGEYPTAITGDFNMNMESLGYERMTKYYRDANKETENDTSITYHGYFMEGNNPEHIDYCFINEKITPCSAKIIKDTVDGKYPSDHFGIHFILEI